METDQSLMTTACAWLGTLIEVLFPRLEMCYVLHLQAALPWHINVMGDLAAKASNIAFTYETLDSAAIVQEEGA